MLPCGFERGLFYDSKSLPLLSSQVKDRSDKKCVSSVVISIESMKWYSFTGELVQIIMEILRLIGKSKICFMEIDGVRKHSQFHYSSHKISRQYIVTPLFIQHHFILFNAYRSNIG